jgi:hypothetical protein
MRRRIVIVAVLMSVAVAACGGTGGGESGIASLEGDDGIIAALDEGAAVAGADQPEIEGGAASDLDAEEAMLAFAECMRENGVDMGDPTVDEDGNLRLARPGGAEPGSGGGIDREAVQTAREACREYLEGVVQQFERPDETEMADALLEYAACMRENGYDMADPDLSGGAGGGPGGGGEPGGGILGDLDRDDPAFQAANETCRDLFGPGGLRPGGALGGGRG